MQLLKLQYIEKMSRFRWSSDSSLLHASTARQQQRFFGCAVIAAPIKVSRDVSFTANEAYYRDSGIMTSHTNISTEYDLTDEDTPIGRQVRSVYTIIV